VARRQRHAGNVRDIPGGDDETARIRIAADLGQDIRQLIDVPPVGGRPAAPLIAVDRPKFAVRVRPFVPDRDAHLLQRPYIGFPTQKPEQLVDDRLRVQLLGGEEREAFTERETHLVSEQRHRASPRAILLHVAVIPDVPHEFEVLAHERWRGKVAERRRYRAAPVW
jgi:hypothetical protein